MALFNSKTPEEKEQEKINSEQKRIEDTLAEFNIFEGFECEVIFPEKQLKTTGSSSTCNS